VSSAGVPTFPPKRSRPSFSRVHVSLSSTVSMKWITRMPLCRVVCGCLSLTSRPLERSPTAHWAIRAYTHNLHRQMQLTHKLVSLLYPVAPRDRLVVEVLCSYSFVPDLEYMQCLLWLRVCSFANLTLFSNPRSCRSAEARPGSHRSCSSQAASAKPPTPHMEVRRKNKTRDSSCTYFCRRN